MDLTTLIKIDENNLTKSELKIHKYILNNFDNIENISISQMSANLYVDHSTITRYCQKIGFNGFKDLKYKLEKPLQINPTMIDDNFDFLTQQLSIDELNNIQKDFKTKDNIIFYGEGPNFHILNSLAYRLELYIQSKKFITFNDYASVLSWINGNNNTMVFIMTTKATNDNLTTIMKLAKINNLPIVLITGNHRTELQKYATYIYFVRNNEVINRMYPGDLLPRYQTLFFIEKIFEHILINDTFV